MPEYRAYTVGSDGHFTGFEPLVCADDAEATEKAQRLVDRHDIELWTGSRLVAKLSATPRARLTSHIIEDGKLIPKPE
ncbi:hypothetical protein [Bradyrhizobium sp. dw_411]|uniref:hypothetical protein n=1 Tax=Bradyrhizobium sp. dw_411 TaxID=2720082 RepID=UPI001BCF47BC|nr:hypothetical protein [Bradyrhizobium sp. dw_411]